MIEEAGSVGYNIYEILIFRKFTDCKIDKSVMRIPSKIWRWTI